MARRHGKNIRVFMNLTSGGTAEPIAFVRSFNMSAATDKVELKTQCRMVGDIKAPRILIADGASFKGNVDMDG